MELPFKEDKINENTYMRVFSKDTDDFEFMWHRDKEDRIIQSIEPTDWKIQLDNELPKDLNSKRFIPKEIYHRLIKGNGDLKIILQKL